MAITLNFGKELGGITLPDDVTREQAMELLRTNGKEMRKNLIAERMAQLEMDTKVDEATGEQPGFMEQAGDFAAGIGRAAGTMTGQGVRFLGRMATQMPMPDGEMPDSVGARYNEELRNRTAAEDEAAFLSDPVTQAGERVMEGAKEKFPVVPGREGELRVMVGEGVGSVLGLAPAALAGPAAPVVSGLMYGASAGESAAMDADQTIKQQIAMALSVGDTAKAAELERTRFQKQNIAAAVAAPIGAITEGVLGVGPRFVGRLAGKKAAAGIGVRLAEKMTALPEWAAKRAAGALEGGVREMAQEGSEQVLFNTAAKLVYDPDREISEGVAESMIAGGLTGKLFGGVMGVDMEAARGRARNGDIPSMPLPNSVEQVLRTEPVATGEEEADLSEAEADADMKRQREVDAAMQAATKAAEEERAKVSEREAVTLKLTGDLALGEEAKVEEAKAPVPAPAAPAPAPVPAAAPVLELPAQNNNFITPAEQSEMDRLETTVDSDMASKEQVARLEELKAKAVVAPAVPAPAAPAPAAAGEVEVVGKEAQPGEGKAAEETEITLNRVQWLASPRGEVDPVSGKARVTRFKVRNPKTGAYNYVYAPAGGKVFDSWEQAEAAAGEFIRELVKRGAKTRTNENGQTEFVAGPSRPALPAPAPAPQDWAALEAKASKQGLKVILEADGETQAVSLKGKPAAIALKKQRGTVEALRALVDCLGKA
jgi:hypothetical protein